MVLVELSAVVFFSITSFLFFYQFCWLDFTKLLFVAVTCAISTARIVVLFLQFRILCFVWWNNYVLKSHSFNVKNWSVFVWYHFSVSVCLFYLFEFRSELAPSFRMHVNKADIVSVWPKKRFHSCVLFDFVQYAFLYLSHFTAPRNSRNFVITKIHFTMHSHRMCVPYFVRILFIEIVCIL